VELAAAARLNSNIENKGFTFTGLPNAWIGLLVAAFEDNCLQKPLQKHSPWNDLLVRSRR
jgi:hypothetical protein